MQPDLPLAEPDSRRKVLTDRRLDVQELEAIGDWWRLRVGSRPLLLRPGYLGPPAVLRLYAKEGTVSWHAPMKDLIRRHGIALRLHLVALFEMQRSNRGHDWNAQPLPDRSSSHDVRTSGRLVSPSWATLTFGREDEPHDQLERRKWRRSRNEAVANGFNRLAELELYDRANRTLLLEDRPWRRNVVASRTYHAIGRHEPSFKVPPAFFTSGDYLRLTGVATYSLLVALADAQGEAPLAAISRHALTKTSFYQGVAELVRAGIWQKYIGT